MANIPTTRISLLTAISKDANCARWSEFVRTYESPMRGFLFAKYPSLEADDVIQETMMALVKALPNYRYTPDENGHFRNYLMGILNHKACDMIHRRTRESDKLHGYHQELVATARLRRPEDEEEERSFREALMNAAVDQLLSDAEINPTHREIFRHVVMLHEPPAHVAAQFNTTRNNVDQVKNRLRGRLVQIIHAMDLTSSDQPR